MRNMHHVLFDDGARVQLFGDVMRRCANNFYSPFMRLSVGVRPNESGQERVVNVDHLLAPGVHDFSWQHSHVAGKNH